MNYIAISSFFDLYGKLIANRTELVLIYHDLTSDTYTLEDVKDVLKYRFYISDIHFTKYLIASNALRSPPLCVAISDHISDFRKIYGIPPSGGKVSVDTFEDLASELAPRGSMLPQTVRINGVDIRTSSVPDDEVLIFNTNFGIYTRYKIGPKLSLQQPQAFVQQPQNWVQSTPGYPAGGLSGSAQSNHQTPGTTKTRYPYSNPLLSILLEMQSNNNTKSKNCECGADKVGAGMHSSWCPKS